MLSIYAGNIKRNEQNSIVDFSVVVYNKFIIVVNGRYIYDKI